MTCPLLTDQKGFGFVGMLLLVLLVSAGVAAVMAMMQPSVLTSALRLTNARVDVLRLAVADYKKSHGGVTAGTLPPTLDALYITDGVACLANNDPTAPQIYQTVQGWCGPYIDRVFGEGGNEFKSDGWGQIFGYNAAAGLLTSCGPNQTCGDADDVVYAL